MGILTRAQRALQTWEDMQAQAGWLAALWWWQSHVEAVSQGQERAGKEIKRIHPWHCWHLGKQTGLKDLKWSVVVHMEVLLWKTALYISSLYYTSFTKVRGPNIHETWQELFEDAASSSLFVKSWFSQYYMQHSVSHHVTDVTDVSFSKKSNSNFRH